MKTKNLLLAIALVSLASAAAAQTVLVTGPCAVIPARCYGAAPVACHPAAGYVSPPVCVTPVYAALAGQSAAPNVIYFGGPNSRDQNSYGCGNSSVIYFGRGQACYGGYAFTRHR